MAALAKALEVNRTLTSLGLRYTGKRGALPGQREEGTGARVRERKEGLRSEQLHLRSRPPRAIAALLPQLAPLLPTCAAPLRGCPAHSGATGAWATRVQLL
jgi:hypothetical protein